MKIYVLKLKQDLRITVDGQKKEMKQGDEVVALTLQDFKKYSPYCEATMYDVEETKLSKLIKSNLEKLDAKETKLGSKNSKKEAQKRVEKELKKRKEKE